MNLTKTPIRYYGGKQMMAKDILLLFPKDYNSYIEPFAGGAAIFFAKEPSKLEVLNDMNGELVNFYRVCKVKIDALMEKVDASVYSSKLYGVANCIYNAPCLFDDVVRAWALWYLSRTSFGGRIGEGFSVQKEERDIASTGFCSSKRVIEAAAKRLECCTIIEGDALECIKYYDNDDAFFYIDPPYVGANQGHYGGYTQDDFNRLLDVISNIKGKFLLSSYDNDKLTDCIKGHGWNVKKIETTNFTSHERGVASGKKKRKIEVLTYNYDI